MVGRWPSAPPDEQAAFVRLLEVQDPVMYGYCLGSIPAPAHLTALVERITSPAAASDNAV